MSPYAELERWLLDLDGWRSSERFVASRLERVDHPAAAEAARLLREGDRHRARAVLESAVAAALPLTIHGDGSLTWPD